MSIRRFVYVFAVVALFSALLSACASQQEFSVVDLRSRLGEVYKETTGNVDNSKGTDDLQTDVNAVRQFQHDITLKLNQSANLDEGQVRQKINSTYDIKDSTGSKSCVIPADVPAGHIYAYDIEWTQVLREGNIVQGLNNPQGDILGTYSIVADLQCQVVGVEVKK